MSETMLNTLAQDYLDLTLSKSRYDEIDIQWFTESPFWRRTSMRYSREYKILPDYEIGDLKHGKSLRDILDESENLIGLLKAYRATAQEQELARIELHYRSCDERACACAAAFRANNVLRRNDRRTVWSGRTRIRSEAHAGSAVRFAAGAARQRQRAREDRRISQSHHRAHRTSFTGTHRSNTVFP